MSVALSRPRRHPVPSRRRRVRPRARKTTPSLRSRKAASPPRGIDPRLLRLRQALEDGARVERLARTFKALGDPTRSKLVLALSLREMCVSDLATALGASLSATSHQLRILRDLDIVHVRRLGRSQLYVLNEQAFAFCAPRVCQAWKQTLTGGSRIHPAPETIRERRLRHV